MRRSNFSKVVNLPEESKMALSVFSGSEDVIESRRGKDFSYSIIPNTAHSVKYCLITLQPTLVYQVVGL